MYPKSEEYLQNFVDHGGAGIVNVGCDDSYNEKGLDIAKRIHNNNLIVRTTL
ncbi:hypothetical protein KKG31_04570 [Patescibacteria group bacterium]|nr:hypothetical protein [Patescibacteria group bacterium]MBU1758411.1 hypothetical protein [Patescibacteria group bacterium]